MRRLGTWKLIVDGEVREFEEETEMKTFIRDSVSPELNIYFSESKEKI